MRLNPSGRWVLWVWAAIILLSVGIWIGLGIGVAKVAAAPMSQSETALIQSKADQYADWLSEVLRADVPRTVFTVTNSLELEGSAAERTSFYGVDGNVKMLPSLGREFLRSFSSTKYSFWYRRADGAIRLYGVHVVIHEILHRPANYACWGMDAFGNNTEEGITDALTVDIFPAWSKRFLGNVKTFAMPVYSAEVARIRAVSARAVKAISWKDSSARSWRRQFWGASCEGRKEMLAAAL